MCSITSLIQTWKNCYSVSLGNKASYKRRLKELKSWDKPLGSVSSNTEAWEERHCKIKALEALIDE